MDSHPPTIHVYVSYKTENKSQLDELKDAFDRYNEKSKSKYKMEIIFSEKSIYERDNIVEFMDKLTVAGVVVFLLSENYFQSAYCWYELIKFYEKGSLSDRFSVLPIQFEDFNHDKDISKLESAVRAWGSNTEGQDKLIELLGITQEEVAEKIKTVNSEVLKKWFKNVIGKKCCDKTVEEVERNLTIIFEKENERFEKALFHHIENELKGIENLESSWKYFAKNSLGASGIAKKLIAKDYTEALLDIQEWAETERERKRSDWNEFFISLKKIAGWVVLKSIRQGWWVNYKLGLTGGINSQSFFHLNLTEEQLSYSEVVVSRTLLDIAEVPKPAGFELYTTDDGKEGNKIIPAGKDRLIKSDNFIIDSCSNAMLETVLMPLYTDINKLPPIPDEFTPEALLAELISLVAKRRKNYFYMIDKDYLKKLTECKLPFDNNKSVLDVLNNKLNEKLFFIVIDRNPQLEAIQIAKSPKDVLDYMKNILLIDPPSNP